MAQGFTLLNVDGVHALDAQRFNYALVYASWQNIVSFDSDLLVFSLEKYHSWPFDVVVVS